MAKEVKDLIIESCTGESFEAEAIKFDEGLCTEQIGCVAHAVHQNSFDLSPLRRTTSAKSQASVQSGRTTASKRSRISVLSRI